MGAFHHIIERRILFQIGKGEQNIWTASTKYLDSRGWQLSWKEKNGTWSLYASKRRVFSSDQWSAIQSFVYGIVHSTLRIVFRMKYKARSVEYKEIDSDHISLPGNSSILETFEELIFVTEKVFGYEMRLAAPARAASMYSLYQNKQYDPEYAHDYEQFATYYERKLELEAELKLFSAESVNHLKSAARNLEPIPLGHSERLPLAIAFLTLHLDQKNWHWYQSGGRWLYFEGDRLIFSADNKDDFEGFFLGMAYNYAKLPDSILDTKIRGSLLGRPS